MNPWIAAVLVVVGLFAVVGLVTWADRHDRRERQEWSQLNIKKCEALGGKLVLGSSPDGEPLLFKQCKLP